MRSVGPIGLLCVYHMVRSDGCKTILVTRAFRCLTGREDMLLDRVQFRLATQALPIQRSVRREVAQQAAGGRIKPD